VTICEGSGTSCRRREYGQSTVTHSNVTKSLSNHGPSYEANSKSCDIQQFQNQRVAKYHNFLVIRTLCLMCTILAYLVTLSLDRPNHLICHFTSCPVFLAALPIPLSSLLMKRGVHKIFKSTTKTTITTFQYFIIHIHMVNRTFWIMQCQV
jgi:hypothetical protein